MTNPEKYDTAPGPAVPRRRRRRQRKPRLNDAPYPGQALIQLILKAHDPRDIAVNIFNYTNEQNPDPTNISRWNERRPKDAGLWLLGEGVRRRETESPKLGPGFNGLMLLAALERYESLTGILATSHATIEDNEDNLDRIISITLTIPLLGYVSPFDDRKEPQHKIFHGAATGSLLRDVINVDDVPFDGNTDDEANKLNKRSDARNYWNIDNGLYESIDQAASGL